MSLIEIKKLTYSYPTKKDSIKNITCPKCKHEVKETPISIEDVLFTQIFERAQ